MNNIFSSLNSKSRPAVYSISDGVDIIKNITQIPLKQKNTPKISFVKINPVKFRLKIEGAKSPYVLVFSNKFNKDWRIYINELTPKANEKYYKKIEASYFDGEIKEGKYNNIFLDRNTFETLNKQAISKEKHYLVNGYTNSWYIEPKDTGYQENYELIIEYWPQRLFYIGFFISILTIIILIVGYIVYFYKRRKQLKI